MEENKIDNVNKAISVLLQGVNLAQSRGVYNFSESKLIAEAIEYLDSVNAKKEEAST